MLCYMSMIILTVRFSCLAKSESAVILSAKQAAFIRNPEYVGRGSGPDFVTIGHNPYEPNLGDQCQHITLTNKNRRLFFDEYIFERLHAANVPFTSSILRSLAISRRASVNSEALGNITPPYGCHHIDPSLARREADNPILFSFIIESIKQLKANQQTKLKEASSNVNTRKGQVAIDVCNNESVENEQINNTKSLQLKGIM